MSCWTRGERTCPRGRLRSSWWGTSSRGRCAPTLRRPARRSWSAAAATWRGPPEFAPPTLGRLIESEHDVVGVVTQPDRPAGRRRELRPPPAKELAQTRGLPVLQPERVNAPDSLAAINNLEPDAIVIAAYGQILKQPLLDIPRRGCLNVHASLLPKYRGASPVTAAILAGDEETG